MTNILRSNSKSRTFLLNPWFILSLSIAATTFAAPFTKLAQTNGLPSPLVASGRMGLAAIILSPVVWMYYRHELTSLNKRDLIMALFGGALIALHFMLLVFALENTSVLILTVFINTGPLWTALLERIFLKAHLQRMVWFGLIITIFGTTYVAINSGDATSVNSGNPLLGAILSLLGAMAGSMYITVGRSVRQKVSLFPYVWIVFGFGGVVGLLFTIGTGTAITGHPPSGYFWLLMLTLIPQLIGHSGFNYVVGYISATLTSLSSQLLIITASIVAFFLFGEVPGRVEIIGSAIIICGVVIAIWSRNKHTG